MRLRILFLIPVLGALALSGCATFPDGPSVMALQGSSKSFQQFNIDDMQCRDYAFNRIGGKTANDASDSSAARTIALGTVIGAVAGAAIGGSDGAAIGAGTGLVFGSAVGSDTGRRSGYNTQRSYDNAYVQCMYAQGHRVPVSGTFTQEREPAQTTYPPPPPASNTIQPSSENIPPPPADIPPPPPPGVQ